MNNKYKGMLMGSFVADSLALGAHWVYNTNLIEQQYGRIMELSDPVAKNFHPNRTAGEFTHYGDQMLLFFNYLKKSGDFIPSDYLELWKSFFDSYDGYKDHAMLETRKNIEQRKTPCGSGSSDLSGIFYVPVLAVFSDKIDFTSNVETAVRMTHNNDLVVQAAKFLAEILKAVLGGLNPISAIETAAEQDYINTDVKALIESGINSIGVDTRKAITGFGQSCPADYGLPGVIHLIGRYENDFENGLIENVMAGGDSAARGIFAGAVLGAHNGLNKIPERWMNNLAVAGSILGDF